MTPRTGTRSGAIISVRESIPSRALSASCSTTACGSTTTTRLDARRRQINNPGRYLVLLPPINGETASSAAINSPYFTGNPGDPFKAWDTSVTFDYMPKQWLTFRLEGDYRHASVPYWSGHGGVTPPGSGGVPYTNNGSPQFFACNDGNTSGALTLRGRANGLRRQGSTVWFPDLRRDEQLVDIDIMVKF